MEKEKTRERVNLKLKSTKSWTLFCSVMAIALLGWLWSENRRETLSFLDAAGKKHVLEMPAKDKKRLFGLMEQLFAKDSFAYTVLGSKPLSWATYHNPTPISEWSWDSMWGYSRKMRTGWKTWQKYCHLFRSSHLWAEYPKCYPSSVSILIVNELYFDQIVSRHKFYFQETLNRTISSGLQLLKEAEGRSLMHDVLRGDQVLLGLSLGYGKGNALLFAESCRTLIPVGSVWGEEMDLKEEQLNTMSLIEFYLSEWSCPSFAGDPLTEESLALKQEYLSTRETVINYYKNRDFLEATLSLLAGYRPEN